MLSSDVKEMHCKHCGDAVIFTGHTAQGFATDFIHANMIRRCLPVKSGQPYGLEADVDVAIDTRSAKIIEGTPSPIDLNTIFPDEPQDRWSIIETADE